MSPEPLVHEVPTSEEANRVGGDQLNAPDSGQNLTTRVRTYDNGSKVTFKKWESLCVIDDVVDSLERDEEDGLLHESVRIQLRISDQVKQLDPGRVTSEFCHAWWSLAKYSDDQLSGFAKTGAAPSATPEQAAKKGWAKKMMRMSMGNKSMGSLCRALGYQDRLVGRTVYQGFTKIKDLVPHMPGKKVTVVFEKGEDRNGEMRVNVRGFKKA